MGKEIKMITVTKGKDPVTGEVFSMVRDKDLNPYPGGNFTTQDTIFVRRLLNDGSLVEPKTEDKLEGVN